MDIIGLTGFARSGKDVSGKIITNLLGHTRFAFADPIRESLLILDPFVCGSVRLSEALAMSGGDWDALKKNEAFGSEVRRLMQSFGTEVGRSLFGYDVWVDQMERRVRDSGADAIVVTDVRFTNEAEWILARGGWIIEVTRPGVGPVNGHVSDSGLSRHLISSTIANDGTLEDLSEKLTGFLNPAPVQLLAA
jgi:hypothetical protein